MRILVGLILILAFSIAAFGQSSKMKPLAETFSAPSLDGTTFDLAQLKGKIVMITFWTTRCAICVAEIPKLNQLAANYQGKDVVFLGLTTDNEAKVQNFIKKKPFTFNLLPNSFGILLKYAGKDGSGNVNMGYPTHFLINQKGEIELKTDGFDKIEMLKSNIIRLLPKNSASSQTQTIKE
jgi:peroxiredoxin